MDEEDDFAFNDYMPVILSMGFTMAQIEKGVELVIMAREAAKRASKGEITGFYPSEKELHLMAIAKVPSALYSIRADNEAQAKKIVQCAYECQQKILREKYYL